jgi:hypothetical protein
MATTLILLIVLLTVAICAFAGYWSYRDSQERKHRAGSPQPASQTAHRSARNQAWDRAVRSARNRNW